MSNQQTLGGVLGGELTDEQLELNRACQAAADGKCIFSPVLDTGLTSAIIPATTTADPAQDLAR